MGMPQIELRGKVALVTGSARRVGKAIALELAAQGMHLIVHHSGSSTDEADETAEQIRAHGVHVEILPANLSDPEQIGVLFESVAIHFGRLDLLVNNAASFERATLYETSLDMWRRVLDLNLTAPMLCAQHAAPLMHDGGAIINIIDMSAFKAWKTFAAHSVSKAGLKMLTEVMALTYAPNIRVNAIAPGPVLRDEGNSPERWHQIGQHLPVQHTGEADDVARAVAFLAAQPFITGETLRVNGGDHLT
jgi:pteridine reductase